jgi:hypothetical protein
MAVREGTYNCLNKWRMQGNFRKARLCSAKEVEIFNVSAQDRLNTWTLGGIILTR